MYLSIFSFVLEHFWSPLYLTTLDSWQSLPSSLTIPAVQWHQLCASPFEFCCQLHFLWIKCFRIPGSPEYKPINYVSTQQHLSLKLGIIYLASAWQRFGWQPEWNIPAKAAATGAISEAISWNSGALTSYFSKFLRYEGP